MTFTFAYMCFMIIYKWCINWSKHLDAAPSIITLMIDIPLKMGSPDKKPLWGNGDEQTKL